MTLTLKLTTILKCHLTYIHCDFFDEHNLGDIHFSCFIFIGDIDTEINYSSKMSFNIHCQNVSFFDEHNLAKDSLFSSSF